MKNKKIIIIFLVIVFLIMLIPIPNHLKDGGTVEYKAILYQYTKIHRLNEKSKTGYENGWDLSILGFHIGGETTIDYYVKEDLKTNEELSFTLKEGSLTNKGAIFILKNNSDIDYCYDPSYYIEGKDNNNWNEIVLNEPLVWNSVLYSLKSHEEIEINIDWGNTNYGALKKGEYRLVKNSFRKKDSPDSRLYNVSVEFNIE